MKVAFRRTSLEELYFMSIDSYDRNLKRQTGDFESFSFLQNREQGDFQTSVGILEIKQALFNMIFPCSRRYKTDESQVII